VIPHEAGRLLRGADAASFRAPEEAVLLQIGAAKKQRAEASVRTLRLDDADRAVLDRLVAETGLPASEVVRRCLRAVGDGDPIDREAVSRIEEQLRKIGTNLNQIARRYNSGQVVMVDEMAEALAGVVQVLDATERSLREMTRTARSLYRARAGVGP
jgi:hypothetical protein